MTIKYKEYFMEPVETAHDRFDLYVLNTVQSGKTKGEENKVILGYGYHIHSAFKRIAYEELAKNNEIVTPVEFKEAFITIHQEIKDAFMQMDMIE